MPSPQLQVGDECIVVAGELIPGDGEIIDGIASVDESAITGESAPVIRESGGDRSAVTGGTRVLSDRIVVRITAKPGETFLDRMIALVEGASRQKTPNEIALNILLSGLTIIFLLATVTLQPFAIYSGGRAADHRRWSRCWSASSPPPSGRCSRPSASPAWTGWCSATCWPCRAGPSRRRATARRCCSTRPAPSPSATARPPPSCRCPGVSEAELADAAQLSSLADETPEGRSIVVLAKERYGLRERELVGAELIPFTAQTRMSGVVIEGRDVRKGAADSVKRYVEEQGGTVPPELDVEVEAIATQGGTPLTVVENGRVLGVIQLKDVVKSGMRERFDELRAMGIRTVMITGDNPLTAAAIAEEAGVDDFLAEATPEDKMALIKKEQAGGFLVAMTGDGTNDAPALAQADVGRGHEHRHPGGQGSREHGRPRLEPDQAHRDRRDRQAAAHHPGLADHVLDRQRRGQVLRHHPGHVRRGVPRARDAQHHEAVVARARRSSRPSSSTPSSSWR